MSPSEIERLRSLIHYDHETGRMYSKVNRGRSRAGDEIAPTRRSDDWYRSFSVGGTVYLAHRVAFAMTHGFAPEYVDHINGDRQDNRACNLRAASVAQNNRNIPKKSYSTSRFKGVSKNGGTGRWRAQIRNGGKLINLGSYGSDVEAAFAYDVASIRMHGEFGRTNFLPMVL